MSALQRTFCAALLWVAATPAALLAASVALAEPAAAPDSAVVSVADGPPFLLIRRAAVLTAGVGAVLRPGDFITTRPDTLLILELKSGDAVGAVVALGPSTRVYWLERRPAATFAILDGWIKVDTRATVQGTLVRTEGVRLGASSRAGVYVVHAGTDGDEVFHESGAVMLVTAHPKSGEEEAPSPANEFARRTGIDPIQRRPGPSPAFAEALPAAFRDPLPLGVAARLRGNPEPQWVREVAYDDVADWLDAPREWRAGFVGRFRPRLKDATFSRALDVHLHAHPEWTSLLHPPPGAPPPGGQARDAP